MSGCLKSHLGVIKLALERGYKKILILEDDTEFIQPFSNFYKICRSLKDYDMLYLAGSHIKKCQPIKISGKAKDTNIITGTHALALSNIKKVVKTVTTGSYCIGEKAMRFFVANIIRYPKEVDTFYGDVMQPKFACYCIVPHMTKQLDGYSDIQGACVKYKLKILKKGEEEKEGEECTRKV